MKFAVLRKMSSGSVVFFFLFSGRKQDPMVFSTYNDKTTVCAESRHFYSQWEHFFFVSHSYWTHSDHYSVLCPVFISDFFFSGI